MPGPMLSCIRSVISSLKQQYTVLTSVIYILWMSKQRLKNWSHLIGATRLVNAAALIKIKVLPTPTPLS